MPWACQHAPAAWRPCTSGPAAAARPPALSCYKTTPTGNKSPIKTWIKKPILKDNQPNGTVSGDHTGAADPGHPRRRSGAEPGTEGAATIHILSKGGLRWRSTRACPWPGRSMAVTWPRGGLPAPTRTATAVGGRHPGLTAGHRRHSVRFARTEWRLRRICLPVGTGCRPDGDQAPPGCGRLSQQPGNRPHRGLQGKRLGKGKVEHRMVLARSLPDMVPGI